MHRTGPLRGVATLLIGAAAGFAFARFIVPSDRAAADGAKSNRSGVRDGDGERDAAARLATPAPSHAGAPLPAVRIESLTAESAAERELAQLRARVGELEVELARLHALVEAGDPNCRRVRDLFAANELKYGALYRQIGELVEADPESVVADPRPMSAPSRSVFWEIVWSTTEVVFVGAPWHARVHAFKWRAPSSDRVTRVSCAGGLSRMVKKTLLKALLPIGASRQDEVRASLVVRGERLDPTRVTRLLGVAPTELHRSGDPRIGRGGRVFEPFLDGMWELTLVGRRGERLEPVVERLLESLPEDRATWRRVAALGQATLWCAAFLKNSTADFAPSAALVRRLADRRCALRLNVYADIVDRRTKRGIPLRFSISDQDVAACARCIAGLSGVARGIYWIDVAAFDHVYAHTRPTRKSDPPGGNMICLKKTADGWYVDDVVTFTRRAPLAPSRC